MPLCLAQREVHCDPPHIGIEIFRPAWISTLPSSVNVRRRSLRSADRGNSRGRLSLPDRKFADSPLEEGGFELSVPAVRGTAVGGRPRPTIAVSREHLRLMTATLAYRSGNSL